MAPKHAFLFDMPVRYVLGAGITTGVLWTFLRPKDVALAQEPEKKPKVLVRTASGAIPPGLAGSEREMDYAKRMGMAK
eukprot:TRINITY_DN2754_c0_g1_i1.p4 TRINITY_DN2754_c0_g1~~TRINITY_DN2754_c0_g1_i1.p4  ORF type:complete len:78 (+),score=11.02 TRINITY_DN2754_c0_g1_i1:53-286(+)